MIYVLRQWKDGNVNGVRFQLDQRRLPYTFIEAYESPQYPDLQKGDAVIALGGPPSVCHMWEPDYEHEWLIYEAGFLGYASALEIPFMGICLGHQLRAKMDNNTVERGAVVFGVQDVELTPEGRKHWLFEGMPERFRIYQHHADHVRSLRNGAKLLGHSGTCPVEAAAWDDISVSVQFHPEVLRIQFTEALEKYPQRLDESGMTLDEMLARLPDDYQWCVNRLFDNFLVRAGVTDVRLAK